MRKRKLPFVACPECGGHRVGRLSANQYYCGDCCIELLLQPTRRQVEVFRVDEEGNLVAVGSRPLDDLPARR